MRLQNDNSLWFFMALARFMDSGSAAPFYPLETDFISFKYFLHSADYSIEL